MTERDEKGRFIKGESGNPGGRPSGELSITALIDNAVTPQDWAFIFNKLLSMARRGNLKAIEMLMDRRFGKAVQAIDQNNTGDMRILVEYANREIGS